jgi:hypothetical protein
MSETLSNFILIEEKENDAVIFSLERLKVDGQEIILADKPEIWTRFELLTLKQAGITTTAFEPNGMPERVTTVIWDPENWQPEQPPDDLFDAILHRSGYKLFETGDVLVPKNQPADIFSIIYDPNQLLISLKERDFDVRFKL